ncbi:MAG: efflux RND transporter permease subunit [Labilithrix sp.]|nr:efflux RND transporter permease subunit [Labilithrix sp.]MCW5812285.1 efflux RND transporter permease subunit [Labilithrix sp.]
MSAGRDAAGGPTAFAVRRWQFTLVVFLAVVALGVQSLFTVPKSEDPTFPFATFVVVAVLPGSSPTDVERLVVDPLETKLKSLADVKTMRTEIEDGVSVTRVEFVAGSDPTEKHDAVLRETTALRPTLPPELARLEVRQFNAANVNVAEVALVSETASYRELEVAARTLRRRLENLGSVGEVTVAGLPKLEVTVTLDLDRMVALGVHPQEVIAAVGAESANVPAGSVEAGSRRFNVQTSGDYASIDEVRTTIVRSAGSSSIRVADVATVTYREAEDAPFARFDGKRAVLVTAPQREGKNIFETKKVIDAELAAFAPSLPPSIHLERGFDQSANVAHRMSGFTRDFGLAIFLVLLTLLPLGWRASVIVMVSIPLSLAMGLFFLDAFGFGINQLSIVGFVLALGLLVDDSVVVVENITRHVRAGRPPVEAAIAATKQITVSVLGCTATLLFAFLPLLMLPGNAGQFIRSLPVAVVVTIAASLLVSLTVVPFLASRVLVPEAEHGNVFLRGLTWLIEGSYRRVLDRAMAWPRTTLLVGLAVFAGALALVPKIGFSLFPKAGVPQVMISVQGAEGSALAETDRAARFVESIVAGEPRTAHVATTVGKGHPQIYYNVVGRNEGANVADVFVVLEGHEPPTRFVESVRAKLRDYPGPRFDVVEFENGPPLDAPIAIRLLGDDPAALERAASDVEELLGELEGTRDVRNPASDRRTDLRVKVDRDKAAVLGVSPPDVDRAVRLAIGGVVAGKYRDPASDEARDIKVTLPRRTPGAAPDVGALERLYVGAKGAAVPLAQVASIVPEPSPSKIRHHQKERSVTVTAHVKDGYNTDRLTKLALARLAKIELPKDVRAEPAGELENRQESFGGLGAAIVIAIFGVLAILVLEFRTFKSTLIVASVLPLGVIGGLVALYVSGNTLSFTANIGFVALMGIEVKNSILLVDFTNQLREEGASLDDAIRKAGEARFVPILLTTLTAIGGLVPLVLERSSLYSPLAIVILGGLVSSTLLARVVTPVLYKLLAPAVSVRGAPVEEPRAHGVDDALANGGVVERSVLRDDGGEAGEART